MEVDHDGESAPPRPASEGSTGDNAAPTPPSRQGRMRSVPMITQSRWATLLARFPPGDHRPMGPPILPRPPAHGGRQGGRG
eukprot:5610164-Pyramimonas_sp.AAC.1